MIDGSVALNLSRNVKDLKGYYKSDNNSKDNTNTDNKSDFKSYLSKEVSNKISDTQINNSNTDNKTSENADEKLTDLQSNDILNKELIAEFSEKCEKILKSENLKEDSLDENLNQVILLLLNIIEVNVKDININNSEEINNNKSELIGNLSDLSFINDNTENKVVKEEINLSLNSTEENSSKDIKEVLNNINNLLVKVLDKMNSNKLGEDISINNIENDLLTEIEKLINVLPEKTVKEVEKNLSTDFSKNIFNTLILKIKNPVENKEVVNSDKSNIVDIIKKTTLGEINPILNDEYTEENFNNDTTSKNTVSKKEEKVLIKILENDNDKSFSKVLNYYDKLNKTNQFIEVIKEPVVVNKDNINMDFIKNIKYMVKNSVEELNVKIYPKELGEMTIKLISEEGIMKAEIKATSKETYNLLNSNLNDIKKTLENQNIRIQEVNIGIYNEDTTFFSGRENSKEEFENQNIREINSISLDEEEAVEDLLNDGNVNFLA